MNMLNNLQHHLLFVLHWKYICSLVYMYDYIYSVYICVYL